MTIAMPSDPEARLAAALHEACYSAQTAGRGPGHGRTPTWCVAHKSRWPEGQWVCDTLAADLLAGKAIRTLRISAQDILDALDSLGKPGAKDEARVWAAATVAATALAAIEAAKEAERE